MRLIRIVRLSGTLTLLSLAAGCAASAPPPAAPIVTFEQKMAWILRLEDRRILRDPELPVDDPPPATAPRGAAPAPTADLVRLLADGEARVRRRAALAVGRVGLAAGIPPLIEVLAKDAEPEVRQMAAFALGLLAADRGTQADDADPAVAGALRAALADPSPLVQGRAAEALGRTGDASSADGIADMIEGHVSAGALSGIGPDELGYPLSPGTEAVRLGIYGLARLKAWAPLSRTLVETSGTPRTRWWPLAYAARSTEDPAAIPILRQLVSGEGVYTRAFAARGLGAVKDTGAFDLLQPLVADVGRAPEPAVEAVRALAALGDARALPVLVDLLRVRDVHPGIRAETVRAIGTLDAPASTDVLLDLLSDRVPEVRAAALVALARVDQTMFLTALSGMDVDADWRVRAARARALATLPVDTAAPLLEPMADDGDQRVVAAVLGALAERRTPEAARIAFEKLKADDLMVRAAAASALGELRPEGAAAALTEAARFAARDAQYDARTAAMSALAALGRADAEAVLTEALADKDWAVRLRATELLAELDPSRAEDDEAAIRPAPTRLGPTVWESLAVITPPVSTHWYVDTDKGTVQVELAVLDAPLTVHLMSALASQGYFGGLRIHRVVPNFVVQDGDPRGDGSGGPGYTMRDEINQRPYLRGTVGMALDWADTGGSQFFITHSPQPRLDGRYTVFGQVIDGMDVVDRLAEGDLVRGIRVWDGTQTDDE